MLKRTKRDPPPKKEENSPCVRGRRLTLLAGADSSIFANVLPIENESEIRLHQNLVKIAKIRPSDAKSQIIN